MAEDTILCERMAATIWVMCLEPDGRRSSVKEGRREAAQTLGPWGIFVNPVITMESQSLNDLAAKQYCVRLCATHCTVPTSVHEIYSEQVLE